MVLFVTILAITEVLYLLLWSIFVWLYRWCLCLLCCRGRINGIFFFESAKIYSIQPRKRQGKKQQGVQKMS